MADFASAVSYMTICGSSKQTFRKRRLSMSWWRIRRLKLGFYVFPSRTIKWHKKRPSISHLKCRSKFPNFIWLHGNEKLHFFIVEPWSIHVSQGSNFKDWKIRVFHYWNLHGKWKAFHYINVRLSLGRSFVSTHETVYISSVKIREFWTMKKSKIQMSKIAIFAQWG